MSLPTILRISAAVIFSSAFTWGDVRLPAIISDHMVLKKSRQVPIWGMADPGEKVNVTLGGRTAGAQAGPDGKWLVTLDLKDSAPGPFEMTVEGRNKLAVADVVVGEVWVASGQSNMEWTLNRAAGASEEIAASANPLLRQFLVKKATSPDPLGDVEGAWTSASPDTSGAFTAVGYFFGKTLQAELKCPFGLINTSWGGTPSEAWTSIGSIDSVPDLKAARERLWATLRAFPEFKKSFVGEMSAWIKSNAREDRPTPDPAAFAGLEAPTDGWMPVRLPGAVAGEGIPKAGVVWLRKEVNVPEKAIASLPLWLPIDGFESVYWNGELLKQTKVEDFPGTGNPRRNGPYDIPPGKINAGRNILAIRLYEPVGPAKFTGEPKAGAFLLAGEWQAKPEVAFPDLDEKTLAAAPRLFPSPPAQQNVPGALFNGMVAPLIPYAISGAIWYQGEANAGRAMQYREAFPLLITDWRKQWGAGDFPFYFCQLANYQPKKPEPGESSWAELREAQSLTLKLPNTGQAVLIDIGESGDIHPRNKKDVGTRLARIALARDYGRAIPYSGPVFDAMTIDGGRASLTFRHADGGLVAKPLPEACTVRSAANETAPLVRNSPGSELEGFAICGADKKWYWADAKIEGEKVAVWSPNVPAPVAVRYAWADNPTANLFNGADLPAAPFRTDDFPASTLGNKL